MAEKIFSLRRLYYRTKDANELVHYKHGTATACLSVIDVYEHTGSEEDAMEAFMPLGSFAVSKTGDSYLAFPLKGIGKVHLPGQKLLYRVENGNVTKLESACKICDDRVKKMLQGCKQCDSLRKVPQLNPMKAIKVKRTTMEDVQHTGDKRSARVKENDAGRKHNSPFLR